MKRIEKLTHQLGKKSSPQDFLWLPCITKHPEQMEKTTKETFLRLHYKQLEFIIQSQVACDFLFMKVWETKSHNSHTGMWGTTA